MSGLTCVCCNAHITGDEWDSCYECKAPMCEACFADAPTSPYECDPVGGEDGESWEETLCGKCRP